MKRLLILVFLGASIFVSADPEVTISITYADGYSRTYSKTIPEWERHALEAQKKTLGEFKRTKDLIEKSLREGRDTDIFINGITRKSQDVLHAKKATEDYLRALKSRKDELKIDAKYHGSNVKRELADIKARMKKAKADISDMKSIIKDYADLQNLRLTRLELKQKLRSLAEKIKNFIESVKAKLKGSGSGDTVDVDSGAGIGTGGGGDQYGSVPDAPDGPDGPDSDGSGYEVGGPE